MDTAQLEQACRDVHRHTACALIGLPRPFLEQTWGDEYNPKDHLFKRTGNRWEASWVLDDVFMERLTRAYLVWHRVPDSVEPDFWQTLFEMYLRCCEFQTARVRFRVWLFFKRFPVPPYDLRAILGVIGDLGAPGGTPPVAGSRDTTGCAASTSGTRYTPWNHTRGDTPLEAQCTNIGGKTRPSRYRQAWWTGI